MEASVLKVVREGELWGVAADGELLALARSQGAALELAHAAAQILRDSGADARVEPAEPRTFAPAPRRRPRGTH
jgi:archaeosine-15-forming tRNA-guanine transglycosylase